MRYVVIGAGAVGGVIGARLHAAGGDVLLVARGEHLASIQRSGLRVVTPEGTRVHTVPAVADVAQAHLQPDDVVIVAVKSQHTSGVMEELEAAAPPDIVVVCAQNGVNNERVALRRMARIYALCVLLPAQYLTPGEVVQQSAPTPGVLDLGRYPYGIDDTAKAISDDLRGAGFESDLDPAVMRRKYRKLVWNLSNALDAVCGHAARRSDLAEEAEREGIACLRAAGIEALSEEDWRGRWGLIQTRQMPHLAAYGSSSWQSLARGTGSIETDWLNGEIVLLGRMHRVATPVNEVLRRTANQAAREGWPSGSVSLDDIRRQLLAAAAS